MTVDFVHDSRAYDEAGVGQRRLGSCVQHGSRWSCCGDWAAMGTACRSVSVARSSLNFCGNED